MTMSTSLLPAPAPIRCCVKECDYRPEVVQQFLNKIRDYGRWGEDPTMQSQVQQYDQDARGGKVGNQQIDLWDVQQAIRRLRAEGMPVDAFTVASRLCPWAIE